jgi:hypothetical protein
MEILVDRQRVGNSGGAGLLTELQYCSEVLNILDADCRFSYYVN